MNTTFLPRPLAILLIGLFSNLLLSTVSGESLKDLEQGFVKPQDDNHLWCYYYWINDDISKEGITKDLEAMKRVGIRTALIGNINPSLEDGKVPLMSDEWWECMVHVIEEGHRLGIDIGHFNCPGWSQSGGPWVDSEKAMRYLVNSSVKIAGGEKVSVQLEVPKEEFQDVVVLAVPDLTVGLRSTAEVKTEVSLSFEDENAHLLVDGDSSTIVNFGVEEKEREFVLKLEEEITARSVLVTPPAEHRFLADVDVYAKVDGKFQFLKRFEYNRGNFRPNTGANTHAPIVIGVPETTSNEFKLVFSDIGSDRLGPWVPTTDASIAEIQITEKALLERHYEKQLDKLFPSPFPAWGAYLWEKQADINSLQVVDPKEVLDVSKYMDEQGLLEWKAPEGDWIVFRIGMTPTGVENHPAAPQGRGYEIDKINAELIQYHFEQYIAELWQRVPAESRSAFKYVVADSYEMGAQNWTDGFDEVFEETYGYNPTPWLPTLSGIVVSSVEESERFLWDMRRLIADQIAYEYVGGLREIANEYGMKLWLENYGHWGFPSEFLMYGGQSDLIAGEFWNEGILGNIECKAASSAANIYGRQRTFAEAFTAARRSYLRHPAMLKARGDWSFTEGINQIVLHLYIQQPDDERVPGMNAWFGTEFNRHNTWFEQGRHWMDYLRRCQLLLQQGSYVADVCYFISENTPKMTGVRDPELPEGYSYDYINAEVILRDMTVENGKLVLPSGASYSLMVLPPLDSMRAEMASKLEELVKAGGIVYGPKPTQSPTLKGFPGNDEKLKKITDKLWGNGDGASVDRSHGEGRIFNGQELAEVLNEIGIGKDLDLDDTDNILWTHRQMDHTNVYFLTNQGEDVVQFEPVFRDSSGQAQLWNAVTGEMRKLNVSEQTDGGLRLPITMQPHESHFIVFSDEHSEALEDGYAENFPTHEKISTVSASWEVEFKNKDIGPAQPVQMTRLSDWSEHEDPLVKHYSGTATYRASFYLGQDADESDRFLNLGTLGVMAEVAIDGEYIGASWLAPHRVKIPASVDVGDHQLEIKVVNLWRNQLVKDAALPEEERYTWLVESDVDPEEALQPSGLIGPVTVELIRRK